MTEKFFLIKKLKQKAKENDYFHEIHAKKVQQQNRQRKKGPQQKSRTKVVAP